ncbi:Dopey, N-terminal-domain-containing protein [Chytriomyces sp. MP71]|nr:Dopey, N-terminal-domain-containing protein [Chytriomyces sp. MP71]
MLSQQNKAACTKEARNSACEWTNSKPLNPHQPVTRILLSRVQRAHPSLHRWPEESLWVTWKVGGVPRHQTRNTPHEPALKKDPTYKKYVGAIDAILKLFDAVSEWADFIGALSKLLKTLQQYSKYANVPRKLVVSKRLAQCLNPALPSGVHQKTLEVYNAIFEAAGPAQLSEDLPLWSYGLFPFLQNAAMSVKPILLQIYDRHFLNLGDALKSSLKGFILALLPGLEEEGNEFFDTVMRMLDRLCVNLGTTYFFHCMCLALISGLRLRGAALNYFLRRMPKFSSRKEMNGILGQNTLIISRALANALEDKQILVQRSALELLVVHFPFQNDLFPEVELELIIRAAVGVVLRKDMSLIRRLYSWLLGASNTLSDRGKKSLIATLLQMLWTSTSDIHEITNTYRVIISLMDKDEIGSVIMEKILLDIFMSLKWRTGVSAVENSKEILQSAEMLLDSINPFLIWKHVLYLVKENAITLESDMEAFENAADFLQHAQKLPVFLRLCTTVLEQIPQSTIITSWSLNKFRRGSHQGEAPRPDPIGYEPMDIHSFCAIFYGKPPAMEESSTDVTGGSDPTLFESPGASHFLLGSPVVLLAFEQLQRFLAALVEKVVLGVNTEADGTRHGFVADMRTVVGMVERLGCTYLEVLGGKVDGVHCDKWDWFLALRDCVEETNEFSVLNISISCMIKVLISAKSAHESLRVDVQHLIQVSVSRLWQFLDPQPYGIYHARAVELIWKLGEVIDFGNYIVENVVGNFLSSRDLTDLTLHQHRFGILWRLSEGSQLRPGIAFSRALFLVLDALRSQNPSIRRTGEAWLKTYVKSYARVIEPVLATLLHPDIHLFSQTISVAGHDEIVYFYKREFNMGQVLYSLETLCIFLEFGYGPLLKTLWSENIIEFLNAKEMQWLEIEFAVSMQELNYAEALIYICLRFLKSEIPVTAAFQLKFDKLQSINLDLQPRLLQVLVSMLENREKAARALKQRRDSLTVSEALDNLIVTGREALGLSPSTSKLDEQVNMLDSSPMFQSMILQALSEVSNRPVLQHWIDFILVFLPQIHTSFRSTLEPIISEVCNQIVVREAEISAYLEWCRSDFKNRGALGAPDNDAVILLVALDKIIEFCLEHDANWTKDAIEKSRAGGSNLWDYTPIGMVASVFSDPSHADVTQQDPQNSRDAILELLPGIIEILRTLYSLFKTDPFLSMKNEIRESIQRILRNVHVRYHPHLVEAAIEVWFSHYPHIPASRLNLPERKEEPKNLPHHSVMAMLHSVNSCSEVEVLLAVIEGLKTRFGFMTNSASSKNKDNVFYLRSRNISDTHLLLFLEEYISAFVDPESMNSAWPSLLTYTKECLSNLAFLNSNYFMPALLRLITAAIEKLILTKHFEDKRMRFHMDELYQKLIETSVAYAMRPEIVSAPSLPAVQTSSLPSPAPKALRRPVLHAVPKPNSSIAVSDVFSYFAANIIPNFRRLFLDQERIIASLSNLVYYGIAPSLKASPNLTGFKFQSTLDMLHSASKIPFTSKTWKKEVWDAFLDPKFMFMPAEHMRKWKSIMNCLMSADQHVRIGDLTELVQIFGVYLRDQGTADDLKVFLACCKLLELLLILGTEEFQWQSGKSALAYHWEYKAVFTATHAHHEISD